MAEALDPIASENTNQEIDPDPFAVGFALLSILISGGAYLEMRLQRMLTQSQRTGEFRAVWFKARRTLIHARRITEEFATYVAEDGYGEVDFIFGKARMNASRDRADQLRRLHGNAQITAMHIADDLDDLSEFLDKSYSVRDGRHIPEIERTSDATFLRRSCIVGKG